MGWPFGPPHLTLKPSNKKQEKKKNKQKETKQKKLKQEQQHPTTKPHKANKQKQNQHQKEKQKTRNTKTTKTFQTQTNKKKPPHKAQKAGKNTSILTLLQLYQTKHAMTLKPEKNKQTKKYLLPCSKTTHYFSSIFCFLFTYSVCIATAVFLWKHYKMCFQKNTVFKNTVSKTHFFTHVKKTPFSKKRCLLWFWAFSAETTIFIVFSGLHCFGPNKFLAKTDSVHENARFFSLPDTNSVRQFLLKNPFLYFSHSTLKTLFL